MIKRAALAVLAIFITWSVLDFVIHGVLLMPIYAATASLWRPMEEMNRPMMMVVTLVTAVCFVAIYALLMEKKSLATGLKFGALFGVASGVSMGFGSYSYMPIPWSLAAAWFLGVFVEAVVAGALAGMMVKSRTAQ